MSTGTFGLEKNAKTRILPDAVEAYIAPIEAQRQQGRHEAQLRVDKNGRPDAHQQLNALIKSGLPVSQDKKDIDIFLAILHVLLGFDPGAEELRDAMGRYLAGQISHKELCEAATSWGQVKEGKKGQTRLELAEKALSGGNLSTQLQFQGLVLEGQVGLGTLSVWAEADRRWADAHPTGPQRKQPAFGARERQHLRERFAAGLMAFDGPGCEGIHAIQETWREKNFPPAGCEIVQALIEALGTRQAERTHGLFRLTGSSETNRAFHHQPDALLDTPVDLATALKQCTYDLVPDTPVDLATALKQCIHGLVPEEAASLLRGHTTKLSVDQIRQTLTDAQLTPEHIDTIDALFRYLVTVEAHQDTNGMTRENLAVLLTHVLASDPNTTDIQAELAATTQARQLMGEIIRAYGAE